MEIRPLSLIHYPYETEILEKVVCPPYDKLTNDQIREFRNRDEHNFVRVILGETLEDHHYYQKAAQTLRGWVRNRVLLQDEQESLLVYRQGYTSPLTGEELTRCGFFALLRLPEREERGVLPHERTFSAHKEDRLRLYRAVRGTPEAIFVLYSDERGEMRNRFEELEAAVSFEDFNGHRNELCPTSSPSLLETIRSVVEPQTLLIADGHHRFETGQNYRDECRAAHPGLDGPQPWDYIFVYFAAFEDPGLVILPTHRVVKGVTQEKVDEFLKRVRDFFDVEETNCPVDGTSIQETARKIHGRPAGKESFGFVTRDRIHIFHLRDTRKLKTLLPPDLPASLGDLPVVWLHRILLEQFLSVGQEEQKPDWLAYLRTGEEVDAALQKEGYDAAFLVRGTRPEEVREVAQSGERMPQKSTDFYPKILSGLAVYLHP